MQKKLVRLVANKDKYPSVPGPLAHPPATKHLQNMGINKGDVHK